MIEGVNVDITIRDNETGTYLRIPVIPEAISMQGGDAITTQVSILQLGTVEFFNGRDVDTVSFSSFFPARYDAGYCKYVDLSTPVEYAAQLDKWKAAGTSLQLIIPAADINKKVRVSSCPWDYKGFEGDIYYSLTLKEKREVRPIQISTAVKTIASITTTNKTAAARTAVPAGTKATTYTVKSGDTLVHIAKKLGLTNWRSQLYEPNKRTIGTNPNKIYPGQVLKV